jgi:hypothetical protein
VEAPDPKAKQKEQPQAKGDWEYRLGRIDWSLYHTAYGVATAVPRQLRRLRSENEEEALSAAHDLWCGLCHQHVQIGSAALPALPFLLEVFATAGERLKVEILDILLGLTITSNPIRIDEFAKSRGHADEAPIPWIADVRSALVRELPLIVPLRMHANPDIAEFSREIVEELLAADPSLGSQLPLGEPLKPDFYSAADDFARFAVSQGYPLNLLWVTQADVVLLRWMRTWTYFVWKGEPNKRQGEVRIVYQNAMARNVGLTFEAKCKTDRWTICRVYVPENDIDAQYRMIPDHGVKMNVATDPKPTMFIRSRLLFRFLRWCAKLKHSYPVFD